METFKPANNQEEAKETENERQERLSAQLQAFFEEQKFLDVQGNPVRIESVAWPEKNDIDTAKDIASILEKLGDEPSMESMFLAAAQRFLLAPTVVDSLEGTENHHDVRRPIEDIISDYARGVTKEAQALSLSDKEKFAAFEEMYSHGRLAKTLMVGPLDVASNYLSDIAFGEDTKELQREQAYWLLENDPENPHGLKRYDSLSNAEKVAISQNQAIYVSLASRDVMSSLS